MRYGATFNRVAINRPGFALILALGADSALPPASEAVESARATPAVAAPATPAPAAERPAPKAAVEPTITIIAVVGIAGIAVVAPAPGLVLVVELGGIEGGIGVVPAAAR